MGGEEDLYEILGVAPTATPDEIRRAYHVLAARYHPDRHQGNSLADLAHEKLAGLNRAYAVLSDPAKRAEYDARRRGPGGGYAPGTVPPRARRLLRLVLLALALFLLARFGVFMVRAAWRGGRLLQEALASLAGTPLLAAVVALLVVGGGVWRVRAWLRARSHGKRST